MSERIDHAAESEQIAFGLNEAVIAHEGITDATIIATAIDAHRHATLALVEQQRIANRIALAGLPVINGFENEIQDAATETLMGGLLDSETVPAVPGYGPAGIDEHVFIRPEIREALGLP